MSVCVCLSRVNLMGWDGGGVDYTKELVDC
jgi:hypothetical protein